MDKTRAFLNLYSICAQRKNVGKDHPNYLDKNKCELDANGNISIYALKNDFKIDLQQILEDFFNKHLKEYKDLDTLTNVKKEKKTYIKFQSVGVTGDAKTGRIWGEIRAGSSGYPSDISQFKNDPKTSKIIENVNYNISSDEHDLCNFFFELFMPNKGHKGVIAFLSLGTRGVVTPVKVALDAYFKEKDSGFKIELSPILMKIKSDKIRTVRKVKMITRPKLDVEDQAKKRVRRMDKKSQIKMTSVITGFDEDSFDWSKFLKMTGVKKINKLKSYFKDFYELENDRFITDFEVEIESDKRKRTIVIQEEIKMSVSIDITADLKKDKGGRYTIDSLRDEVNKIILDVDKGYL